MSGKGGSGGGGGGQQQGGRDAPPATHDNPQVVSGWEYTPFAHRDERYAYLGKDDSTGEPQFVDWGSKSANAAADAAKQGGKK